jgi:hypothetical protein
LAPWEESVTQRNGVVTSVGGEVTSGRGKGGDNASWTDVNLTGSKNKKSTRSIQLLQIDDEDLKAMMS